MERRQGWKTKMQHFPTSGHPKELSRWISNGRYRDGNEEVIPSSKISGFGKRVWNWWYSLQPKWRGKISKSKQLLSVDQFGDGFDKLDCSGPNSWFVILACLRWWGDSIYRIEEKTSQDNLAVDWRKMVDDVSMMLEGYVSCLSVD